MNEKQKDMEARNKTLRAILNAKADCINEDAARQADSWFERNIGIVDIRNYVFFSRHKAEWIRRYHKIKRQLLPRMVL